MRERGRWTVHDLRRDNRSMLLSSLFFDHPRSRLELSEATGLSPASVSNVMRGLIDEGIVVEADAVESDGGRPRVLLRVSPEYGYVIGIDASRARARVRLYDLTMAEQARAEYPLDPRQHGAGLIVEAVLAGIAAVLDGGAIDPAAVLGVGVAIPGIVENGPDGLVHGQAYGRDSVPLGRLLRSRTSLPLYIDNDAKALGQAELWFGAGRDARSMISCLIGSGVGASIITGGEALPGATSSAGEWGHTTVVVGGRACRCGSSGCLEAYAGAAAILDRWDRPRPGGDLGAALTALIGQAATSVEAAQVLNETALYLGAGIADLINLFNPERIIIGGWAGLLLGRSMLPAIRAAAGEHALRHLFARTSIELGRLGPDAVALGAATLPVRAFLSGSAGAASSPAARGAARAG
jgi:predicted NBD/HSP70 family sugar kinase